MVTTRGPLLAGWILVRVGRLARTRRRYVLLRRDLVIEVDSISVRVVGAQVVPQPRERALRVRGVNSDGTGGGSGGTTLRLVLDTSLQFAKWNDALQMAALWDLERFYAVSPAGEAIARGRYSIIREASVLPSRIRVGPCPAVYTPRLDHVFMPNATNEAFIDEEEMRKLRPSASEVGMAGTARWSLTTQPSEEHIALDEPGSLEADFEPMSINNGTVAFQQQQQHHASVTAVTAVAVGFGDRSAPDAAPDSAGPTRPRKSYGSFRYGPFAAVAARSAALNKVRDPSWRGRAPEVPADDDMLSDAGVVPGNFSAAELLRIQTGISPALRASLEGFDYHGQTAVLVKSVAREGLGRAVALSEAMVAHAHVRHHGLVRVLDVFETPQVVHSVLEKLNGPLLDAHLAGVRYMAERDAGRAVRTLLKAVGYLHACGIAHWDIRPANIVLVGSSAAAPKLIDFGCARRFDPYTGVLVEDDSVLNSARPLHALPTASPEMLAAKARLYAPKTDLWQLGCVLYQMLAGRSPFQRGASRAELDDTLDLKGRGRKRRYNPVKRAIFEYCKMRADARAAFLFDNIPVQLSENARSLISILLTPNPRMRPSALQCLQNVPFLQDVG